MPPRRRRGPRRSPSLSRGAADPNGLSDPFVTVEWDGREQSTRVVPKDLNPKWNQTLYFPIKLVSLTRDALQKKPPVSMRVFDHDEAGRDLLGSCEIHLHEITSAEHDKVANETDVVTGAQHKGRVLRDMTRRLAVPGTSDHSKSTLAILAYFVPDLPADLILDAKFESQMRPLDGKCDLGVISA